MAILIWILSGCLIVFDCFIFFQIKRRKEESASLFKTIEIQNTSINNLKDEHDKKLSEYNDLVKEEKNIQRQLKIEQDKYDTLQAHCEAADKEYNTKINLMITSQEAKEQQLCKEYDILCAEQEERLGEVSRDFLTEWRKVSEKLAADKKTLTEQVEEQRITLNAAIEAAKRAQLEEIKKDYYKILLDESAAADIERLRSIEPVLSRPEALNKIIWKVYYEKPVSDMIGRVVGDTIKTGIYKITNCINGMAYVGQAVDIASRWRQHIKRGVGAETPTQNKLYPAMKKFGPESFTFEILEECDRSKLDVREDYWQDFYRVKEFGYSIK